MNRSAPLSVLLVLFLQEMPLAGSLPPGCPANPATKVRTVAVRVMDSTYGPVKDIPAGDFVVRENGVMRPACGIRFIKEPISTGILLDTSGSMHSPTWDGIAMALAGIDEFLKQSGPQDEYFLEYIRNAPEMRCTFSCDLRHVRAALQARPKGQTALLDAIYVAMDGMQKAHYRNRSLLIVSDGGENASLYNWKDISHAFPEPPASVFALVPLETTGLPRRLVRKGSDDETQLSLLKEFSVRSGGRCLEAFETTQMRAMAFQLASLMRWRYLISYVSDQPASTTVRREAKLRVTLRRPSGRSVLLTPGFWEER